MQRKSVKSIRNRNYCELQRIAGKQLENAKILAFWIQMIVPDANVQQALLAMIVRRLLLTKVLHSGQTEIFKSVSDPKNVNGILLEKKN